MSDKLHSSQEPQMCVAPQVTEEELMCTQPYGNAAAQADTATKPKEPLIDSFDICDVVLTPLEMLAEAAPGLGAGADVVDDVAKGMGKQAGGALGVLGGVIGLTEGAYGLYKAQTDDKDDNAADIIPSLGHLASGGLATAGGIGALAGMEGLAAMGPLGAAVAAGGFLGKHAGEWMWEQDQKAHAGPRTEEAKESYELPEEKALFNVLEGNWDKVWDSKSLW